MKHQALLTYWAKLKLEYYFFNLAVESIESGEILVSVWQEEENFEALKRCYIQIYPTSVLFCYGKAVFLFNICETYSGVMWSSWKRNSGTQLSQSVSDIKLNLTFLLHSNWSNLRRKYWSKIRTDMDVLSCGPKASNISGISDNSSPRFICKILAACTRVCRRWWRNLF